MQSENETYEIIFEKLDEAIKEQGFEFKEIQELCSKINEPIEKLREISEDIADSQESIQCISFT